VFVFTLDFPGGGDFIHYQPAKCGHGDRFGPAVGHGLRRVSAVLGFRLCPVSGAFCLAAPGRIMQSSNMLCQSDDIVAEILPAELTTKLKFAWH